MKKILLAAFIWLVAAPAFATLPPFSNAPGPVTSVGSGTFANKPAAASATGKTYYASDLGTGILLVSNGTNWKPVGGIATIASASLTSSITGTTTETSLATVTVPAGMLSVQGSLEVDSFWLTTNNANAHALRIRHDTTAGGITGTPIVGVNVSNETSIFILGKIRNNNSVSAQISPSVGLFGPGAAASAQNVGAINTAVATFIDFNGALGVTTDTITLTGYTVKWIEP